MKVPRAVVTAPPLASREARKAAGGGGGEGEGRGGVRRLTPPRATFRLCCRALAQSLLLSAVAPGPRDDTASARMRLPRRPARPRSQSAGSVRAPAAAAAAALDGRRLPRPPEERTPHLRCLER